MIIAQLTDTHIRPEGNLAYGVVDTAPCLSRAAVHLAGLRPKVDAVLVTGDLTDFGTPEEYRRFRSLTEPVDLPLFPIPGNHDDAEAFRVAFPEVAARCESDDLSYVVEDFPVRLVLINTTVPGAPYGEMTAVRLEWLERQLSASPDRPTLIGMHHPPFLTGIQHMDVQNCRGGERLAEVVERHPQVLALICGHVHRSVFTRFAGRPASIGPAPAHAVSLDLRPEAPSTFHLEPPSIHLHVWAGGGPFGQLLTHQSYIGAHPGPFPFFDDSGSLMA